MCLCGVSDSQLVALPVGSVVPLSGASIIAIVPCITGCIRICCFGRVATLSVPVMLHSGHTTDPLKHKGSRWSCGRSTPQSSSPCWFSSGSVNVLDKLWPHWHFVCSCHLAHNLAFPCPSLFEISVTLCSNPCIPFGPVIGRCSCRLANEHASFSCSGDCCRARSN